jgi:hypothetical protein
MRRTIIVLLLLVILIIVLLLFLKPCLHYHPMAENILIGLLSSSIVVFLIETISHVRDLRQFSYLSGKFRRVTIYDKKDKDCYEDITQRYINDHVCPIIKIKRLGEGRFQGTAHYEEGKVAIDILLDAANPVHGFGAYQYTFKKQGYPLPDFGKYELFRDKLNNDRVYVYYENIAPTKHAQGYEIWEKT